MSYDLLVFDKRRPPTNQSDFLDWYNQRVEEGGNGYIIRFQLVEEMNEVKNWGEYYYLF